MLCCEGRTFGCSVVQCSGQLCVLAIFSRYLCSWGKIQSLHFCFRVPGAYVVNHLMTVSEISRVAFIWYILFASLVGVWIQQAGACFFPHDQYSKHVFPF